MGRLAFGFAFTLSNRLEEAGALAAASGIFWTLSKI
jgi:hypothetical protein